MRIQIQDFDDKKITKKLKIATYFSLGLYEGRQKHRRILYPSKDNIKHFKTGNFFTLVGHFCPFGSGS
jgi:hypothetical protein